MIEDMKCPCHSGKLYQECCAPYHSGAQLPVTSLQLMRSRYSAYALGLADYIISTTHPENPSSRQDEAIWKKNILEFSKGTTFYGLTIESTQDKDNDGTVTFHAHLLNSGKDTSFRETSLFQKINGKWFYKSGSVTSIPSRY